MTLEDFVSKYKGKKVDYDGKYGYQCVDLFRQYCKDVLDIPHTGGVVGAVELFTNYEKMPLEVKHFHKIAYAGGKPDAGDVVVFGQSSSNKYGHVAIVISATESKLTVFEQDGFKQDGAKIADWGYERVLGFLRKRKG